MSSRARPPRWGRHNSPPPALRARGARRRLTRTYVERPPALAATRSGDAYNDPAVQAKLQEIMGRGIGTLRGVVDAFLVGYAEGKNEEIRRALDEEIARQRAAVDALRAAHAEAGVAPGPPGGVAAGPAAGTGVTAAAAASSGPPSAGGHPDTRGASPTGEALPSSDAGGLRDAPPAAPR